MIKQLVRRSSLALLLATSTVATVGTAHAGITGTDPCPVNWHCAVDGSPDTMSTLPASGAVTQVVLVLIGLA